MAPPSLLAPNPGTWLSWNGVAVLVEDDLGVFGVVDAAGAEPERLGDRAVVGVVVRAADDVDLDRPVQHVREPELLEIALHPVDVEIDHDLFERLVGAAEQELTVVALDPGGGVR